MRLSEMTRNLMFGKKPKLGPKPGLFPADRIKALTYLRGEGLEIGALHNPVQVPAGCHIHYLDVASKADIIKKFPEVPADRIVDPEFIGNICDQDVAAICGRRFDFIIMNHVLEHVANPIRVIEHVLRGLNPGGIMLISIPDKNYTYDKKRPITDFNHLLGDYHLGVREAADDHYLDFLSHVHPEAFDSRGKLLKYLANVKARYEHVHVWDSTTAQEHLRKIFEVLKVTPELLYESLGTENELEYLAVVRVPGVQPT